MASTAPSSSSSAAAAVAALRSARACSAHGSSAVCMREPRAAPGAVRKNVTVPETCEFYGTKDAISGCRYPRSCRDCLAMKGCYLTGSSECKNATLIPDGDANTYARSINASLSYDAAPIVSENDWIPYHTFLAGNATYCAADDRVCSKCRDEFRRQATPFRTAYQRIGSQFCLGEGGCVCIAACEVPQVRDKQVYDVKCGLSSKENRPAFADPNGRLVHSITTRRREPRVMPMVDLVRNEGTETCGYYAEKDIRGCRRPRTCQDCLQREGCVIAFLRCQDMKVFNRDWDYRHKSLGLSSNATVHLAQFPSFDTTMCPASDPVCAKCRAEFRSGASFPSWDNFATCSQYCVGANGCVCIEACESGLWSENIEDTECKVGPGRRGTTVVIATVLIILAILFIAPVLYDRFVKPLTRARERMQHATRVVLRHMLDVAPGFRLDLFGWRGFQQRLIYKETQLLQGEEVVSPVMHPVDFMFADPSAPEFEEEDSSAPTASDPRALASAPVYRALLTEVNGYDAVVPSAPWLEDTDQNHLSRPRPNASGPSGVTYRASRHRSDSSSATEAFSELSMGWR